MSASSTPLTSPDSQPKNSSALLRWLDGDPQASEKIDREMVAEIYRRDVRIWLFGSGAIAGQVRTRDEHDPTVEAKPFPDKVNIRALVDFWLGGWNRTNAVPKSRQMLVSWTLCALYQHDAQFGI